MYKICKKINLGNIIRYRVKLIRTHTDISNVVIKVVKLRNAFIFIKIKKAIIK